MIVDGIHNLVVGNLPITMLLEALRDLVQSVVYLGGVGLDSAAGQELGQFFKEACGELVVLLIGLLFHTGSELQQPM